MAAKSYYCNVKQGFEFRQDVQDHVGIVTALKIGAKDLKADFSEIISPEDGKKKVKAVGVISGIDFAGGKADPIAVNFNVSTANKVELMTMLDAGLVDVSVTFTFEVWSYDPIKKAYYKAFHNNGEKTEGLVAKSGSDFLLAVSGTPDGIVDNPLNYAASIVINPANKAQALQYANSSAAKASMPFGVAQA